MASVGYGIDWTFITDVDFENRQYEIVATGSTDDYVKVCSDVCGVQAGPIGIIQDNPSAGMAAQVRLFGMSKAIVDASNTSTSFGDFLSPLSDSPRKLEIHDSGCDGDPFAIAMEAVASGSAKVEVWILGGYTSQI